MLAEAYESTGAGGDVPHSNIGVAGGREPMTIRAADVAEKGV